MHQNHSLYLLNETALLVLKTPCIYLGLFAAVPTSEDALLRSWTYATCTAYGALQSADQKLPAWAEQAANHSKLLADMPNIVGMKVSLPYVSALTGVCIHVCM